MRASVLLAVILLGLTSGSGVAAVYRCERDGATVYTDTPCAAGAVPEPEQAPPGIAGSRGLDLQADHEARAERDRSRQDQADAAWLQRHAERRAREARVHAALTEGRVVPGMSAADVRHVWGAPDSVQALPARRSKTKGNAQAGENADAVRERWVYRRAQKSGGRTVEFENGVVSRLAGAGSATRP